MASEESPSLAVGVAIAGFLGEAVEEAALLSSAQVVREDDGWTRANIFYARQSLGDKDARSSLLDELSSKIISLLDTSLADGRRARIDEVDVTFTLFPRASINANFALPPQLMKALLEHSVSVWIEAYGS